MKTTPQSIPALQRLCGQNRKSGPSGETQTLGLVVPNHAFYQLNYTRIFNFCYYTTAGEKIKDFSVCGHLCGQSRFCAVFGNRGKTRYCPCRKALRRFASPYPGYRHGTPKPMSELSARGLAPSLALSGTSAVPLWNSIGLFISATAVGFWDLCGIEFCILKVLPTGFTSNSGCFCRREQLRNCAA